MKTRLVVGLALALSGPVLAVEAAAGDWKETLDVIDAQTKATLGLVADPTQGLAAANDQIQTVASAVATTNKAVSEVQASVERLRGPANRVWVSPLWRETEWDLVGGTFPVEAWVQILNTGSAPAQVGCTFFDLNGTLQLDRAKSLTISPGATGFCGSFPEPRPEDYQPSSGWAIVHSDRPILVRGDYETQPNSINELQRIAMAFFPVDCSIPSGIEFVCDIVGP
jgi:hypothetical protein